MVVSSVVAVLVTCWLLALIAVVGVCSEVFVYTSFVRSAVSGRSNDTEQVGACAGAEKRCISRIIKNSLYDDTGTGQTP